MAATMQREILRYHRQNRKHANYSPRERFVIGAVRLSKLPVLMAFSQLEAMVIRENGDVLDFGVVSRRVITTVGVNFIVSSHLNTTELETLNFHAMGTGAVVEAIGDTTLTEVETRVTGTQSNPAGNQYRSIGTITATAGRAVTEHGLFSASTAGTLYDRSVFAAINLVSGDSIQFTYTVTYTAGG